MKKQQSAANILKMEIAEELGLMDKVNKTGWKSLTARESGRIGGLMSGRVGNGLDRSEKI